MTSSLRICGMFACLLALGGCESGRDSSRRMAAYTGDAGAAVPSQPARGSVEGDVRAIDEVPPAAITTGADSTLDHSDMLRGKHEAFARLKEILPTWDEATITRLPESAEAGPNLELAQELTRNFVPEALGFVERRANGRDVYKDPTHTITMKVNAAEGLWKVLRPYTPLAAGRTPYTAESALATTQALFVAVGLPLDQQGFVVNTGIRLQQDDDTELDHARHVRIHRQIHGLRIRDSQFMVTYDLNGAPYRLEMEWPKLRFAQFGQLHSALDVLDVVSDLLAARFANHDNLGELTADLAYQVNAEGALEPVISVSLFPKDREGSPELVEYSLFSGLKQVEGSLAVSQ